MNINNKYVFLYKFSIPNEFEKNIIEQSRIFWGSSGFKIETSENKIIGSRGTLIANYTSFNMKKVKGTIEVEIEGSLVKCELRIDGRGQDMTEWNLAAFKLELLLFRKFLIGEDHSNEEALFKIRSNKEVLLWALTVGILGRTMSDEWKVRLEKLSGDQKLPEIEVY